MSNVFETVVHDKQAQFVWNGEKSESFNLVLFFSMWAGQWTLMEGKSKYDTRRSSLTII